VATGAARTRIRAAAALGMSPGEGDLGFAEVNQRIVQLARAQSLDVRTALEQARVSIVEGRARLTGPGRVAVETALGGRSIDADVILLATGARPRVLETARPDGERLLSWGDLYRLAELPEHLIVVGSGVTGAEFACGYLALGSRVTLVSSRDRVLPGEDEDAARVIEDVFAGRGGAIRPRSRAMAARRTSSGVCVTLADGAEIAGSHVLLAIGSIPNTDGLGLPEAGVALDERGFITVDRVSRTTAPGVYAAGDCTGVMMLASVAAMQGRIAMWHALGQAVGPLDLAAVSATIFTEPEIATVGDRTGGDMIHLPLDANARAKMERFTHGFVKLFARGGVVTGGVVCSPHASELIHPITLAVGSRLTVAALARTFTVYPSLSGSIAEAARRLAAGS